MTTHYQVLGVATDVSHGEIRRAFLRLAKEHHPDRQSINSVEPADPLDPADPSIDLDAYGDRRLPSAMHAVNAAWEVLGDPVARRDYDASIGLSSAVFQKGGGPDVGGVSDAVAAGRECTTRRPNPTRGGAVSGDVATGAAADDSDDHASQCDCPSGDGCGYVHAPWDVDDGHDRLPPPIERIDRDPDRVGLRIAMAVIGLVLVAAMVTLVVVNAQGRGSGTSFRHGGPRQVGGVTPAVGSAAGMVEGSCVVLASIDGRITPLVSECSLHGAFRINAIVPIGTPCDSSSAVADIQIEQTRLCLNTP